MSGTLQARAIRHTGDSQISVQPVACPLAGRLGNVDALYCYTHDHREQRHHCPYYLGMTSHINPTVRLSPAALESMMTEGAHREARVRVRCAEARPVDMPGA